VVDDLIHSLSIYGHDVVLWTLLASSLLTVTVAVERLLFVARGHTRNTLARSLTLHAVPMEAATIAQLEEADGFEGRILAAGLRAGRVGGFRTAEEALAAALSVEATALDRGLILIGSVGSNAPFVGLLGTVLGVVRAFSDLSLDTTGGSAAVMSGISEALVATGIGLLVAIPAVLLYNLLTTRNARVMADLERLSRIVLMQFATEAERDRAAALRRGA
jgi:biopolymer transport protein ExbB/TolQ